MTGHKDELTKLWLHLPYQSNLEFNFSMEELEDLVIYMDNDISCKIKYTGIVRLQIHDVTRFDGCLVRFENKKESYFIGLSRQRSY